MENRCIALDRLSSLESSVDDKCGGTRCDVNANCVFDEGRRQCVCKNGWTGDGTSCFGEYSCWEIQSVGSDLTYKQVLIMSAVGRVSLRPREDFKQVGKRFTGCLVPITRC